MSSNKENINTKKNENRQSAGCVRKRKLSENPLTKRVALTDVNRQPSHPSNRNNLQPIPKKSTQSLKPITKRTDFKPLVIPSEAKKKYSLRTRRTELPVVPKKTEEILKNVNNKFVTRRSEQCAVIDTVEKASQHATASIESPPIIIKGPKKIPNKITDVDDDNAYESDYFKYLLSNERLHNVSELVSSEFRSHTLDWLIALQEISGTPPKIFHSAVSLFDRFLTTEDQSVKTYKKIALVAFFISFKLHGDENGKKLIYQLMDYVNVFNFTVKEITQLEKKLLQNINFHIVLSPVPFDFLDLFINKLGFDKDKQNLIKVFAEILIQTCMFDIGYTTHRPSLLAITTVYLACQALKFKFTNRCLQSLNITKEGIIIQSEKVINIIKKKKQDPNLTSVKKKISKKFESDIYRLIVK